MMRRNLSEGSDESPRDVQQLEATERRLARRLQLLDELKARDLHECSCCLLYTSPSPRD